VELTLGLGQIGGATAAESAHGHVLLPPAPERAADAMIPGR